MNRELLINEPVDTLIRVLPNGDVRPTSFIWRDRTRYVNDVGRHWEEIVRGQTAALLSDPGSGQHHL